MKTEKEKFLERKLNGYKSALRRKTKLIISCRREMLAVEKNKLEAFKALAKMAHCEKFAAGLTKINMKRYNKAIKLLQE